MHRGAAESLGEFIVFLNDDAEVLPEWLEALVDTADRFPDAGAVGSLILFPDGAVQEADAITWRDGSTPCLSRGVSVQANPYDFVRPVDYDPAGGSGPGFRPRADLAPEHLRALRSAGAPIPAARHPRVSGRSALLPPGAADPIEQFSGIGPANRRSRVRWRRGGGWLEIRDR